MSPSSSLSLSTLSQKCCWHNEEIQAIDPIYKYRFCCFKQSVADLCFPQHDQDNHPEDDEGLGLEILWWQPWSHNSPPKKVESCVILKINPVSIEGDGIQKINISKNLKGRSGLNVYMSICTTFLKRLLIGIWRIYQGLQSTYLKHLATAAPRPTGTADSTLPTGEVGQKYYALKKSSPFVNSRWKWTSPIENGLQKWKKWSPFPAKWSPFPAMWSPFPANWSPFPAKWSPFPAKSSPFPANKL